MITHHAVNYVIQQQTRVDAVLVSVNMPRPMHEEDIQFHDELDTNRKYLKKMENSCDKWNYPVVQE